MIWHNKNQVIQSSFPRMKNQKQNRALNFRLTRMKWWRPCKQTKHMMEWNFSQQSCRKMSEIRQSIFEIEWRCRKKKLKVKKGRAWNRKKRRQHWYSIVLQWFCANGRRKDSSIHTHTHTFLYLLLFSLSISWSNWIKPSANMLRWVR